MILTVFLICGCQTTKIEKYDFPPRPQRPVFPQLPDDADVSDLYVRFRSIMMYTEQLEAWAYRVEELAKEY